MPTHDTPVVGSSPGPRSAGAHPPPPRGERLPRTARVCRRNDFHVIFRCGGRTRSGVFSAVVCATDFGFPRLGLAVSRRVGNAVVRNRVKRRLRELFRRHRAALPGSVDLVVIPQPGAGELPFDQFRAQVLELFARSHRPSRPRPEPEGPRPRRRRNRTARGPTSATTLPEGSSPARPSPHGEP
ncbi:MAG: ribonuclease P protein component [Planctomycetota bacterium]